MKVLVTQLCLILCNPMDCSPPSISVHRILQGRYWNGQPFPSPGNLLNPGIESTSPVFQINYLPFEPPGQPIYLFFHQHMGLLCSATGKKPTCKCRRHKRPRFDPWVRKILWRRARQSTSLFSLGQSPWTEEPGEIQSTWPQRDGLDQSDLAHKHISTYICIYTHKSSPCCSEVKN